MKIKIPLFGKKKLITSFEYGLNIAKVAKDNNIELTKELVERAEKMIINELSCKNYKIVNKEMIPNILAVFQPKD
jgi:NOL1/NOP2/fmu family ribosome biogenesis protein